MTATRSARAGAFGRLVVIATALAALAAAGQAEAGVRVVEKRANLEIARLVAERLRDAGVEIRLTRTGDRTLRPSDRTRLANRPGVDAFISIHNNASRSGRVSGTEIYRSIRRDGSGMLGRAIRDGFDDRFSGRRLVLRTKRGCCGDYYYQLRRTRTAAVLVECAYVTNRRDGTRLATSDAFARRLAGAIAAGVLAWQEKLTAPPPSPDAGLSVPAPLAPPSDVRAGVATWRRVSLSWTSTADARWYRVYRDGRLLGTRRATSAGRLGFADRWAEPSTTYTYLIRPAVRLADGTWGEGAPALAQVTTPPLRVVLDPGHGGRDPGAVARYR